MNCRFTEIRCKEVINIADGCRLGFVNDIEVDIITNCVVALVIPGPCRFFGLFGREEDFVVPWNCIRKIGEDIILVDCEFSRRRSPREKTGGWFFQA